MAKQHKQALAFGNKRAFVFTLDAALSVLLVIAILTLSSFYLFESRTDPYAQLQARRIADDVVVALDRNGSLQTLDAARIQADLDQLLTQNYAMAMEIDRYHRGENATGFAGFIKDNPVKIGTKPTAQASMGAGQRPFVTLSTEGEIDRYCVARYWIWLK